MDSGFLTDLGAAVSSIRMDIDDTSSKLCQLKQWYVRFADVLSLALRYNNQPTTAEEYLSIINNLYDSEYPFDSDQRDNGLTVVAKPCYTVRRWIQDLSAERGTYSEFISFTLGEETTTLEIAINFNRTDLVIGSSGRVNQGNWISIEDFKPEDAMVGNFSVLSLTSKVTNSLQVNEFLKDMTSCVRNPYSFQLMIQNWNAKNNVSSELKDLIHEAMRTVDGKPTSILLWLRNVYESMGSTTVVDGEVTFADTNYVVNMGFTTIGSLVATTLASLVGVICFAINKVVGLIVMGLTAVVQQIFKGVQSVENPLIKIKDDASGYFDSLPIPLCQRTHSGDAWSLTGTEAKTLSISTPVASFRVFKNTNSNETNWEGFLRMTIHPDMAYDVLHHALDVFGPHDGFFVDNDDWSGYSGPEGINDFIESHDIYSNRYVTTDPDPFYILTLPNERTQATNVLLNLLFYYVGFCQKPTGGLIPQDPELSVTVNLARLKDLENATMIDLYCFFRSVVAQWVLMYKGDENTSHDDSKDWDLYFLTDQYPSGGAFHAYGWDEIINIVIPAVRKFSYFDIEHIGSDASQCGFKEIRLNGDFVAAQSILDSYMVRTGRLSVWCDECFNHSDSPFIIPKISGRNIIRDAIIAVVLVATIVSVSLVAISKFKKWGLRQQEKEAARLADEKKLNDEIQSDPDFTAKEKAQYLKYYQKQVKRYNLTSFLYGGGTFNMVNGWVDYSSSEVSTAGIAESLSKMSSYNVPMVDEGLMTDADARNVTDSLVIQNILTSICG